MKITGIFRDKGYRYLVSALGVLVAKAAGDDLVSFSPMGDDNMAEGILLPPHPACGHPTVVAEQMSDVQLP